MREFKKGAVVTPAPTKPQEDKDKVDDAASKSPAGKTNYKLAHKGVLEYEEFDPETAPSYQEPFALLVWGGPGSGKTRLGMTQPGKIGLVSVNRKTMMTAKATAQEFGKKFSTPKFDLFRSTNPIRASMLKNFCENPNVEIDVTGDQPWCCSLHNARWVVNRQKEAAFDLYARPDIDSIFLDGWDIMCEDFLVANYGRDTKIMPRDRKEVNREHANFLNALSGKHVVITANSKDVWVGDGNNGKKVPGKFERGGWAHVGYHVNTICQMTLNEQYNEAKTDDFRFGLTVKQCQARPALIGDDGKFCLKDDMITFPNLAQLVYPKSTYQDWA